MLQAIIDKEAYEGLNEAIRAEYKESTDGKYMLDVAAVDGYALDDIKGLKSALAKERQNVTEWKSKAERYGDLDPDKAKEALANKGPATRTIYLAHSI